MKLLIRGGRVIDPGRGADRVMDILVENGKISRQGEDLPAAGATVIDARGLWVMPGLIDLHVHFRDPGDTKKESMETGSRAALAGGFTTVCCMPNTRPVCHDGQVVRHIRERGQMLNALPVGSLTVDQAGERAAPYDEMVAAGVCALSEDGRTLADGALFREALTAAARLGIPMFSHCEDAALAAGGVINAGAKADALGLPGISNESEWRAIKRDIASLAETGARLHICHVSTRESLEIIRRAKEEKLPVTAEVTPHHLFLCEEDISRDWAGYKMNPPLRTRADMEALRRGLAEGVLDAVATDHAPHRATEKNTSFLKGANGIVGLETALSLCITELVESGCLSPLKLSARMSRNPARILGLAKGTLTPGEGADITIIDPGDSYVIRGEAFQSKCKITPFEGRRVRGKVKYTIVGGVIRYSAGAGV